MTRFEKNEIEKRQIREHFKRERRKVTLIFWPCVAAGVVASYFITKLMAGQNFIQWFLISLLFIVVFPITQYSKKHKELRHAEEEQIKLSQQDM